MSNIWHDISPKRINTEDFICVIEISKNSKKKYELDKETGYIMLDRILYTSTHYPANYGFIPRTYGDDNDPLDVLLLCAEPLEPMSLVRAYPIGVISMIDNGRNDEKIIAIPFNDPNYNQYTNIDQLPKHVFDEMSHFFTVYKNLENKDTDIDQLPPHVFDEMRHFFTVYKNLEHKETAVNEVSGRSAAIQVIKQAIENYIENFCK